MEETSSLWVIEKRKTWELTGSERRLKKHIAKAINTPWHRGRQKEILLCCCRWCVAAGSCGCECRVHHERTSGTATRCSHTPCTCSERDDITHKQIHKHLSCAWSKSDPIYLQTLIVHTQHWLSDNTRKWLVSNKLLELYLLFQSLNLIQFTSRTSFNTGDLIHTNTWQGQLVWSVICFNS